MRWRLLCWLAAGAALVVPPSGPWVERWYSHGVFPPLQRLVTSLSNLTPFAWFDVLIIAIVFNVAGGAVRDWRRRHGPRAGWWWLVATARRLTTVAAVSYLAFLITWGLNYRRLPLTTRVPYDASRLTPGNARRLAELTVQRVNALYGPAHAEEVVPRTAIDHELVRAFAAAQRSFDSTATFTPARPKRTMFDLYFRRAGVAGMTDPYFLETFAASDLLPFERPHVIAHEWAHLSGIGDEGEANFAGWLACLRGSPRHQYSGWLFLYGEALNGVAREDARQIAQGLGVGPRADLEDIRQRMLRQISPAVSFAGWRVYDQYLKANRVDEGVASYGEVVRLVLGTGVTAVTEASGRSPL